MTTRRDWREPARARVVEPDWSVLADRTRHVPHRSMHMEEEKVPNWSHIVWREIVDEV